MQVTTKLEEPNTPPSLTHLSPPITPTSPKDLMHIITNLLQQGQESAQIIRSFFNKRLGLKVEDHEFDLDLDHHSLMALNSFKEALSVAKSFNFDQEDVIIKRKFDHFKAEDPVKGIVSKERRGCYKRRRTGETKIIEVTELVDDGHGWRKYGQKDILNTNFPRNYYRCTHKHDQDCQATKQVQQISETPTKFKIIYNGVHTCKNLNKKTSLIIDPELNSSFILSFDTNNHTSRIINGLNSSNLFPTSSTFLNIPNDIVKQEELPISPSTLHDLDHVAHINQQYSSSSSSSASCDVTINTPVSDQGDSNEYKYGSYDYDDVFLNLIDIGNHQFQLDDIL